MAKKDKETVKNETEKFSLKWWVEKIVFFGLVGILGFSFTTYAALRNHELYAAREYVTHDGLQKLENRVMTQLNRIYNKID